MKVKGQGNASKRSAHKINIVIWRALQWVDLCNLVGLIDYSILHRLMRRTTPLRAGLMSSKGFQSVG